MIVTSTRMIDRTIYHTYHAHYSFSSLPPLFSSHFHTFSLSLSTKQNTILFLSLSDSLPTLFHYPTKPTSASSTISLSLPVALPLIFPLKPFLLIKPHNSISFSLSLSKHKNLNLCFVKLKKKNTLPSENHTKTLSIQTLHFPFLFYTFHSSKFFPFFISNGQHYSSTYLQTRISWHSVEISLLYFLSLKLF